MKRTKTGRVGILLVTHMGLGNSLLSASKQVLGSNPSAAESVEIAYDEDPENAQQRIRAGLARIDTGAGVLVLSDLFGASPHNFAVASKVAGIAVVSGVNLGMLLSCLSNQQSDLPTLVQKACRAGIRGICNGEPSGSTRDNVVRGKQ